MSPYKIHVSYILFVYKAHRHTRTHRHTHTHTHIYIYMCVCVCVCKQDLVSNNHQGFICH